MGGRTVLEPSISPCIFRSSSHALPLPSPFLHLTAHSSGSGWQRLLRRGVHTLTRDQYQLVYVLDTLIAPRERDALKLLRASEVVRPP